MPRLIAIQPALMWAASTAASAILSEVIAPAAMLLARMAAAAISLVVMVRSVREPPSMVVCDNYGVPFASLIANTMDYPELDYSRAGIAQMNQLLSKCSDQEVHALLTICESVLKVIRDTAATTIEDK